MKAKIFVGLVLLLASCLNEDTVSFEEQLRKDVRKIDQYLLDNGITGVISDASGVRIKIHTLGVAGLPPNSENDLTINYTGKVLSSGSIFDSGTTYKKLPNYIDGWKIALPMLPEGTIATLYLPSVWCYGQTKNGSIPSNANLIFDIELESVDPTDVQISKLQSDVAAIDLELSTFNVNATSHDSGLRYVTTVEGTGAVPSLYSQVKVSYRALLLSDSSEFRNQILMPSSSFSSRVANYPQAVQVGLQFMKEGGKATFFSPSGLAFGPQSGVGVPANSNIVFEIELLDVIE